MKQPSIDAIRRFKEQQERRKLEAAEKKLQDKLTILEHRAAQGDRKAKSELKIIEKVKEERNRLPQVKEVHNGRAASSSVNANRQDKRMPITNRTSATKKPKQDETDFEELMRLASSNNNQIRREEIKQPSPPPTQRAALTSAQCVSEPQRHKRPDLAKKIVQSKPSIPERRIVQADKKARPEPKIIANYKDERNRQPEMRRIHHTVKTTRPNYEKSQSNRRPPANPNNRYNVTRRPREDYYDDDYDDDDDYEHDDFVVGDNDADALDEVSKTIRNLFKYDKRRCDLREAELDRQYRQIGRVSTFEDLEREERRASRLAAVEDAKELREEEERKRLKKLRMKEYR